VVDGLRLPFRLTDKCLVYDHALYGQSPLSSDVQEATLRVLISTFEHLPRKVRAVFEAGLIPRISIKDNHFRSAGAAFYNTFSWGTNRLELPAVCGPNEKWIKKHYRYLLLHEAYGHGLSLGIIDSESGWAPYLALTHVPDLFAEAFGNWLRIMLGSRTPFEDVAKMWGQALRGGGYRALVDASGRSDLYFTGAFPVESQRFPVMVSAAQLLLEIGGIDRIPEQRPPEWHERTYLRGHRERGAQYCDPLWRELWLEPMLEVPTYVYREALERRLREVGDFTIQELVRALSRLDSVPSYYAMRDPIEAMAEHLRVLADRRAGTTGFRRTLEHLEVAVNDGLSRLLLCSECGEPVYGDEQRVTPQGRHLWCRSLVCVICGHRVSSDSSRYPYCSDQCGDIAGVINELRREVLGSSRATAFSTCAWCQETPGVDCRNGHCPICLVQNNEVHDSWFACSEAAQKISGVRRRGLPRRTSELAA
jgi:hypothetical protein